MSNLTREQKLYGAAGAMALFIISLFLSWYGAGIGDFTVKISGTDLDSWWLLALIPAIIAGGVFALEALGRPMPVAFLSITTAALACGVTLVWTLTHVIEGEGVKIGAWLGLVGSVVGTGLAILLVREERH